MADDLLQDKIVKFLSGKPKKCESLTKLINVFKTQKKSINIQLYMMEKEGRIVKVRDTPPMWGLYQSRGHGETTATHSSSRPMRRTRNDMHQQQYNAKEEEKIVLYLRDKQKPMRPIEIAKGTGHSKAGEVNKILYSMLKKGLIVKRSDKPPTWSLADSHMTGACGGDTGTQFVGGNSPSMAGDDVSADDSDLPTPLGVANFQDTELFSNSESDQFSYDNSDNVTDNDTSTFDDGQSGITINQMSDSVKIELGFENSETALSMHALNEDGSLPTGDFDNFEKMKSEDSSIDNSLLGEGMDNNGSENSSNVQVETKTKSFRDFFNLDESHSSGSKSSLDSMGNNDMAIKVEPVAFDSIGADDAMENNSPGNIWENMDDSSTGDTVTVDIKTEALTSECTTSSMATSDWNTPDVVINVLNMEDSLNQSEPNDVGDCENADLSSDKTNVKENAENNSVETDADIGDNLVDDQAQQEDMGNCNKLLKILFEMKFAAQFILKKKTGFDNEELEGYLNKCVSLNYITGSTKLWKITPTGLEYAKQFQDSSNQGMFEPPPVPARAVKKVFKGPPPSPMALLNKNNGNTTISVTNSGSPSDSSSHSRMPSMNRPPSLFKAPAQVNKTVPENSSMNVTQSAPKNQIAPPSLMSLQFDQPGQFTNKNDNQSSNTQSLFGDMDYQSLSSNKSQAATMSTRSTGYAESFNAGQTMTSSTRSNITMETSQSTQRSNSTSLKAPTNIQPPKFTPYNQSNKKSTPAVQEITTTKIPEKYANYPNLSPSPLSLQNHSRSKSNERLGSKGTSSSAFSKGPPPSPMDILSKNMKKTEISPPSSYQERNLVTTQSGSSSMSYMSSTNNYSMSSRDMDYSSNTSTPSNQATLIGSNNSTSIAISKQSVTVNQSSFNQSRSLYSNYGNQSGPQSLPTGQFSNANTMDHTAGQFGSKIEQGTGQFNMTGLNSQTRRGPPPTPMEKLKLQPQQPMSLPATTPKLSVSSGNANLGLALSSESFAALNKNPVSALMEYAQSRKMVATVEVVGQRGSSHKPTFEMAAFVGNRRFPPITCHNKKDGRKEACDIALRQLIAEGQFKAEKEAASGNSVGPSAGPSSNMTHFDTIAALTHRGFTALVSQITAESFAGRKVVAGLVMKRSADDTGVLISLGTGNRCITGQQLSLQGNTVNDSHAEIITRRGFLRFLYKQLLEYDPSRPNPLFEKSANGKIKIRSNITFHLYISTAPCGDGALFSPRDSESNKAPVDTRIRPPHEPTFSNNVQGLLRTKVEGGEGTIPIEAGFKCQTFDGIQRGERLRTMSCTDKICRWNVVGMQGALLSHFLEPVYLDSLTLGLLYDHGHLARAVCCRVGRGNTDINTQLPPSYRLNHPWLGRVTVCDPPREVQKTKALSINWSFGDKAPEVTDGTQGLCYTSIEKGFFSRCSKRELFTQFKLLCEKFGRQDLLGVSSYNEAKINAVDFVSAKQVMLQRFKDNGYGKWVSKPVEEEMFGFEEK